MDNNAPSTSGKKPDLFPSGADWVRADFHLHTQADRKFRYTGDPGFYNSTYVDALETAGIRIGVITNHNKFDATEFKALRSTAKKKGIMLLPGVELSVSDGDNGIHTLIVFSDAWLADGQDHINPFMTVAFEVKTPAQYEQENGRTTLSLLETIKKLEGYQRDFFLVFAHVEQRNGLWAEMGGGRIQDLGKNESFRRRTLGFQKVRTHDGAGKDKACRVKVQQWLEGWYPAEVEGSDPETIEEIGKGDACYLKLGELSFEAVKFALTDPAARVAKDLPHRTTSFIRSIHFEGGILGQQTLRFSPELTTLIGIRGSGKSSILEAVRYALDIPRGENPQDLEYKEALIKHTLGSGGKITVVASDTYGQEFTVSRIFREAPQIRIGGKLQPGVSIRETVLRRPIYFGQKDLASRGEGFEADLVEKLVGDKLRPLRTEIDAQRQRVRDAVIRFQKLSTTAEQKRHYEAELADATFRLRKFEEYGVAEKLKKRLGFQHDASALKRIRSLVQAFVADLDDVLARHEDDLRNAASHTSTHNADFFTSYFEEYARVVAQLEAIKRAAAESKAVAERLAVRTTDFEEARGQLQDEFAEVERRLSEELKLAGAVAIQPDDFLQQQQRKSKADQMLAALTKQETQKESLCTSLLQELETLNELWRREFQCIKAELDQVNANHTALQIEAEFKGDIEAAADFMRQLFRGSGIHETTLRSVMAGYADFGALFRDLAKAKSKAGTSPDLFEKTFLDNLADLLIWQVPNRFVIRYRGKELKHHSLGQRASALILYVLSQRQNDVIIIDQPEDDLDNQTIYDDVIKLIREMKPSIQFIFATHNANFPVLGDAELVHACQYADEKISVQSGSIDSRPIQEAIINIMEGGEEAFNKRKEVYNLWKPRNSLR